MLFGDGPKRNKFANTSVGENNIDPPLHLSDGFVKTIKVGQLGNVSLNARNVGADCLHGLVKFVRATARDEDICTFFDEKLCRSQSNPFCDGGLAFELFGHCLSPLLLNWNSPAPMLHARSLESEHRLNDIPRIKFLWRAPKSRAHLDCPIQGRASAFGHIGPAPWWSAWQGARNRGYISSFLQGSQGYHRSRRAYAPRSQRAA